MRVALGSDHVGFDLKQLVLGWLAERHLEVLDMSPGTFDPTDDYPDFARRVAEAVARGDADYGIAICSTGQGSCMAANKVKGIRAALCHGILCARLSKLHNDANVLCLGSNIVGPLLAREIVDAWLAESFSTEERHRRRVAKIAEIESDSGEGPE
ncbi:MAG TPA: ribose 5-phosphate isomerase B [Armatimonadota bacterium]|nr:ribose 5-phosphate isomerase B [Armatimonadota bacterium]